MGEVESACKNAYQFIITRVEQILYSVKSWLKIYIEPYVFTVVRRARMVIEASENKEKTTKYITAKTESKKINEEAHKIKMTPKDKLAADEFLEANLNS